MTKKKPVTGFVCEFRQKLPDSRFVDLYNLRANFSGYKAVHVFACRTDAFGTNVVLVSVSRLRGRLMTVG